MDSRTPVLITLDYPPQVGGVANYYAALVKHCPVPITVVDKSQLPDSWIKMIPWLYRYVRQHHPSIILVGQVLPLGTVTWLLHLYLRIPYVVFTHGMDVLVPQRFFRKRWLLHRILRSARHIITVSHFTKEQLRMFDHALPDITIIHPAAQITPTLPSQPIANLPQQFILSVGRLVERKGFDMVVKSLVNFPELNYVIAGSGTDKNRLIQLAREYGVDQRVRFFDQITNAEIAYLYQQCVCVVMPSRQLANGDVEGFGIVALEAGAFGKTTIGGRDGGMRDAIEDGSTGLLVDGTKVEEMTEAIEKMLKEDIRKKFEQQAKQYSERVTWEYAAQQLSAIVNSDV